MTDFEAVIAGLIAFFVIVALGFLVGFAAYRAGKDDQRKDRQIDHQKKRLKRQRWTHTMAEALDDLIALSMFAYEEAANPDKVQAYMTSIYLRLFRMRPSPSSYEAEENNEDSDD